MKLVDTNVLIYSVGTEHEYRQSASEVVARVRAGLIQANVDTESFQEILHVYRSRKQVSFGTRFCTDLMTIFPAAILVSQQTIQSAVDILTRYPNLQSRDAVHAAVVLEHNLEGIISADRAFDTIKGLTRFDPKELAA